VVSELTRNDKEISVKVSTKTKLAQFKTGNFFSIRTYADFQWLSDEMPAKHLGCIVPLLPPKTAKISDNLDKIFCQALQKFLQRIGDHPVMSLDPNFQKFLEGEPVTAAKKSQNQMALKDSFKEFSKDMLKKGAEQDSYFDDKRAFVNIHETSTKNCIKHLEKLHKHGLMLSNHIGDLGVKFTTVGESTTEENLSRGIRKVGKDLESYSSTFLKSTESQHELLGEMLNQLQRDLISSKAALDARLEMSNNYDKAIKNNKSKREAHEKLKSAPGSKPEKISKAQSDVAEAEKQESDAKDLFNNTTENLKAEFMRAEKERVIDFKARLTEHVQNQIYFENQVLEIFEGLLAEVENIA